MNEAESVPDITEVVNALNKATGGRVTNFHYKAWLEGEPAGVSDAFDLLVRDFIGKEAYHKMLFLARLDAYLRWKLGLGPDNAGGIVFTELPKTIGEYIDNHFPVTWHPEPGWVRQMRDCPLENEPGVDTKRIIDAAAAFYKACEPISPEEAMMSITTCIRSQLEVIWCG